MTDQVAIPVWQLLYGGKDITGNLQPHAFHVEYHECVGGKANTLQIYLEDSAGAFQNNPPAVGEVVNLSLGYQGASLTNCGLFEVDEWEFFGPPDQFLVKCIQAGITRSLRTPKSVAWEKQSLITIANSIAKNYGMTVVADAVTPDVLYERLTQKLESDLSFLHRLANLHNYDFNIRGNQLVFYSRPQLESKPSIGTLFKTDAIKFRLRYQQLDDKSFGSCVSSYFNPLSKKLVQAMASDPNAATNDTLKIVERLENSQQANARSAAHLHVSNMLQLKGDLTIPGTMLYRAGNRVNLSGFGAYDSIEFFVEEAKHHLTKQGYKTELELRTTITGATSQTISNEFEG